MDRSADMSPAPAKAVLKASEFNVFIPSAFDGIYLAYNSFSGAYAALSAEALTAWTDAIADPASAAGDLCAQLQRDGFLIAPDRDERAELRAAYAGRAANETGLNLTLAPTVSCNFACSYCFEEHPKRHYSDADVAALSAYVEQRLVPGEPLNITWFGGEPLAAFRQLKAMDAALGDIAARKGAPYTQYIITNGSLLTEDRIDYFARQPGFQGAQITLDGPPDIHDRRRHYTAGGPSFDRIMENLQAIAGRFPVDIRVNLDRENGARIPELLVRLIEADLSAHVSVYFGHVMDYTEACGDLSSTMLSREEFAALEVLLYNEMITLGMRPGLTAPQPASGSLCVADSSGAVIAPGGLVFRCWNETALNDKMAYAQLAPDGEPVPNAARAERHTAWQDYDPFAHAECRSCKVQPLCRGGCPWEADKMPLDGPGHCTSLRYNLADRLRLVHLCESIDRVPVDGRGPRPRQVV